MLAAGDGTARPSLPLKPAMSDEAKRPGQLTMLQNVQFEGQTKVFVSLFHIRRQHVFDPFHECADTARQIASMCYDEGHG